MDEERNEGTTHEIRTIADLLGAVTVDNINTLIADLAEFLRLSLIFQTGRAVTLEPVFRWTDDDDPGLSGFNVKIDRAKATNHQPTESEEGA